MLFIGHIGMWLSLVEHYVRDVGAAGSNPVIPTKNGKQGAQGHPDPEAQREDDPEAEIILIRSDKRICAK